MKHVSSRLQALGDFTIAIAFIVTGVAWGLLRLIGLFTNLFYYHRWNTALVPPAGNTLGLWARWRRAVTVADHHCRD